MINEPSVDSMIRKLGTKEDPSAVTRCARWRPNVPARLRRGKKRRASAISAGRDKELLAACKDIDEGRVVIAKD